MPERQYTTYRVDSAEVQGDGSWVELSYLTHGETKNSLKGQGDDAKLLEEHVIAWNWVDKKGKELPQPPEGLDKLVTPERWFLLGKLFNPDTEEEKKNSETG